MMDWLWVVWLIVTGTLFFSFEGYALLHPDQMHTLSYWIFFIVSQWPKGLAPVSGRCRYRWADLSFLGLHTMKRQGDMQDGILAHYLSQARASDGNVEARLDREPFDYREYIRRTGEAYPPARWDR